MALPKTYLITTKNLEAFLNAIIGAQAPERFTQKFLESLEFKSTNDRLFIGLLKTLGFIDETGIPTNRYYNFLDQTQSKNIMTDAIKEAYSDLFAVNKKANELSIEDIKNKFKTLTQGQKTDKVLQLMSNTFHALCEYAEWETISKKVTKEEQQDKKTVVDKENEEETKELKHIDKNIPSLHYNIQIHLPETRDAAVYEALFKSLKDHLL